MVKTHLWQVGGTLLCIFHHQLLALSCRNGDGQAHGRPAAAAAAEAAAGEAPAAPPVSMSFFRPVTNLLQKGPSLTASTLSCRRSDRLFSLAVIKWWR